MLWSNMAKRGWKASMGQSVRFAFAEAIQKKKPSVLRKSFRYITVSTGGLLALGTGYAFYTDPYILEKIQRPLRFWSGMFPIYLQYRYMNWKLKGVDPKLAEPIWEDMHQKYAPEALAVILELRGFFIKVGQVLASRSDIAPETWRNVFKSLFDKVPSLSGTEAIELVEELLGKKISDVFKSFDDVPIGAASVGQVHKAVLKDGRHVVVKIQYPGVKELFDIDFANVKSFVQLAQPEQAIIMDEMQIQVLAEFDFEKEAWSLATVHRNLIHRFPDVIVPQPIPGFTNKRIFVMEYIPGVKLIDCIIHEYEMIASKMGITMDQLKKLNTLPSSERSWIMARYTVVKTGDYAWRSFATLYNYTFGFILPNLSYGYISPDYRKLYAKLIQVHGHEILIDGVFNGDPHPGNVLVTPDGRLGLIDYGQVKSLDQKSRRELACIMRALAKGEPGKVEALQLIRQAGFETKNNNEYVLYKTLVIALDRDDLEATEGMGLQLYMEHLNATDETKKIPEKFFLAVRTCILIRGIGSLLGLPPVSIANAWKEYIDEAIARFPPNELTDGNIDIYTPKPSISP